MNNFQAKFIKIIAYDSQGEFQEFFAESGVLENSLKSKILEIHPTYGSRLFIGQLSDTQTFTFERDSVCTNSIFNRFKIGQSILAKLFRMRDQKKIEIVIFESDFQRFQFLIFSIFLHQIPILLFRLINIGMEWHFTF